MSSSTTNTNTNDPLDVLADMSALLSTGLDRETLAICVALCEAGVNPEALAAVVKELRAEAKAASASTSL
ncbi:mitotic-spindle organizing gamma-tubulin ring associated-domain-containing protein [Blastocladiella britannica]|nr:mitotic-spindle organizing gamma-tubulin ring associated-domain-containing protein [Blastocladiella britannica]